LIGLKDYRIIVKDKIIVSNTVKRKSYSNDTCCKES